MAAPPGRPGRRTGVNVLPAVPATAVAVDPSDPNRVYVGTDIGVYTSLDGGANWYKEVTGFGNVSVESLKSFRGGEIPLRLHPRARRLAGRDQPLKSGATPMTIRKLFQRAALGAVLLACGSQASAGLVTSRAALDGADYFDWGQAGADRHLNPRSAGHARQRDEQRGPQCRGPPAAVCTAQ